MGPALWVPCLFRVLLVCETAVVPGAACPQWQQDSSFLLCLDTAQPPAQALVCSTCRPGHPLQVPGMDWVLSAASQQAHSRGPGPSATPFKSCSWEMSSEQKAHCCPVRKHALCGSRTPRPVVSPLQACALVGTPRMPWSHLAAAPSSREGHWVAAGPWARQ